MRKVKLVAEVTTDEAQRILSYLERPAKFGYLILGGEMSDTITVKDNDPPVDARASFADVEGAAVDVSAAWTADDDNVAVLTVDPDDDQHVTINPGAPGASVIHCIGTNTDGTTVELVGTFTVIAGSAVVGAIEFTEGTPAPEPTV